jgi:hypothetical protein
VSSWFHNVFEEHGLTEDGKTLVPFFAVFCSTTTSSPATQITHLQVVSSPQAEARLKGETSAAAVPPQTLAIRVPFSLLLQENCVIAG